MCVSRHLSDRGRPGGRARRGQRGFTITELIVVMIIIVLLAGLAIKYVPQRIDEARRTRTLSSLGSMEASLEEYQACIGGYPSNEDGLRALIEPPRDTDDARKWDRRGPFLKRVPKDGWGREFLYEAYGDGDFELFSLGKDGKEGGDGFDEDLSTATLAEVD